MRSVKFGKKRGGVFSQVRWDQEQIQKARESAFKKLIYLSILFVMILVGVGFFKSAVKATSSQVMVDRDYLESLEQVSLNELSVAKTLPVPVISSVFTKEVQYWSDSIVEWAALYGLNPNLVATVMQIESCGDPTVRSPAGAQGLFQVMPFHFVEHENASDPDTNAYRGLTYLSRGLELADRDVNLALAGYNGGHSVIGIDSSLWFDETKDYVYWGMGIIEDILQGANTSQRLEEWLSAGGASLCRRAAENLNFQ